MQGSAGAQFQKDPLRRRPFDDYLALTKDKHAFIIFLFLIVRRLVMCYFPITLLKLVVEGLSHLHRPFLSQMIIFLPWFLCSAGYVLMDLVCPSIDCSICKPSDLIYGFALCLGAGERHGAAFLSLHLNHYLELLSD